MKKKLTLQRDRFVHRLCRVEAEELSEFTAVLRILVDTELKVLSEGFIELLEVVLILRDLLEEVKALLDYVLADNL